MGMLSKKRLPDLLSLLRICCCAAMLVHGTTSLLFSVLYALAGLTDALDGYLARRFHAESARGAMLDSIADACFLLVVLLIIVPTLTLPMWALCLAGATALIRVSSLVISRVRFRRFALLHTHLNRWTGLLLFFLCPMLLLLPNEKTLPMMVLCCIFAIISACEELYLMLHMRTMNVNVRSALMK